MYKEEQRGRILIIHYSFLDLIYSSFQSPVSLKLFRDMIIASRNTGARYASKKVT